MQEILWKAPIAILAALVLAGSLCPPARADQPGSAKPLDVPFEPTHPQVVEAMLQAAGVQEHDYLVDLGCGDGRVVIAAASKYGARALGVDIDPQRIRESQENARLAGVADRVAFQLADINDVSLHEATVVTMYLLNSVNLWLRPKLFRELRPGTRVISHAFDMADWEPDRIVRHPKARGAVIYSWTIPARLGGTWTWKGTEEFTLSLTQHFQAIGGSVSCAGCPPQELTDVSLWGKKLSFRVRGPGREILYHGEVEGDTILGSEQIIGASTEAALPWRARRSPVDLTGCWAIAAGTAGAAVNTLCISGDASHAGILRAQSVADGKSEPVPAFYHWGTSVRFEAPGRPSRRVFTGVLDGDQSGGVAVSEGTDLELRWTAVRVATAPDSLICRDPSGATARAPLEVTLVSQLGARRLSPVDGSELVWVPGGRFSMGSESGADDEQPVREVTVAGFWLSRFEVTNAQYARFLQARPNTRHPMYWDDPRYNAPDLPVVGVTWLEAVEYCNWAGVRLPTEAEWEFAARGGAAARHPNPAGESCEGQANLRGVSGADTWEYTSPVGSFPPNGLGLFDMAGNAWEWTSTQFAAYPYSATDGREEDDSGRLRVLRGGCWQFPADYCRSSARHRFASHLRYDYAGFRVALSTETAASH